MASTQPADAPEQRKHVEDLLDEALEESFPASDAPAVSFPEPEPAERA
ncbi:MAG: hypothetical protein J2P39_14560 [Candidatus Dormibacteraeota bacterium]|nr:hypothetical protein [Candidatus Dormibacteraeota bacterium]